MKYFPQFEIGDWIITIDGRCVQIKRDDMPDLPYEDIVRPATTEEIMSAKEDAFMKQYFQSTKPVNLKEHFIEHFDTPIKSSMQISYAPEIPDASYLCTRYGKDRLDITKAPQTSWETTFKNILIAMKNLEDKL